MVYLRREAAPPLDRIVDHLWVFSGHDVAASSGLLFADVGADVMFDIGAPLWLRRGGSSSRWRGAWVSGQRTSPITIQLESRRIDIVGARLRPAGLAAVLGAPAAEVVDEVVELPQFWGALAEEVLERLAAEPDAAKRLGVLEAALMGRIAPRWWPPTPLTRSVEDMLQGQRRSIESVKNRLGVSHKHLTRLFHAHVGLGPKALQRVGRFRRLLTHRAAGRADWARLAVQCGYFDQAHLCGDFREFAGITPTRYSPPAIAMPDYMPWAPPVVEERLARISSVP